MSDRFLLLLLLLIMGDITITFTLHPWDAVIRIAPMQIADVKNMITQSLKENGFGDVVDINEDCVNTHAYGHVYLHEDGSMAIEYIWEHPIHHGSVSGFMGDISPLLLEWAEEHHFHITIRHFVENF